jgi:ubiquitin C-terminal hydrolase
MVRANKRMGVDFCAPVLIIHFKRFYGTSVKVDTPVQYPDVLDTSSFSSDGKGEKYRLLGVVLHRGSLDAGHYTAMAFDEPSGKWYHFNDSICVTIPASKVHNAFAYIVFYIRGVNEKKN